jgi:hypothetical protein
MLKHGPVRMEVIDQIPPADVTRVVQDFMDSDAEEVKSERNEDDTWTVTATFRLQ